MDWPDHLRTVDRLCWYLCRHGHQDYEKVRLWPLSWIIRGTRAISDLLDKEYGSSS